MFYSIIFLIVLFAADAMTIRDGLWSNTITLVNILISGIVAFAFYAPIVVYLDETVTAGQHTYWLDFAVLWAVFCVAMLVCRTLTGALSKTRMRFKQWAEIEKKNHKTAFPDYVFSTSRTKGAAPRYVSGSRPNRSIDG